MSGTTFGILLEVSIRLNQMPADAQNVQCFWCFWKIDFFEVPFKTKMMFSGAENDEISCDDYNSQKCES
jgi:hypothetical protein